MRKIFILGILILSFLPFVQAQSIERKSYTATRITAAPTINGLLEEEVWKTNIWVDDFTQNEPYSGRPATQRTEFSILFDDNFLYVAIKAYDTSPDSIVNRLARRDEIEGDLVAIIIDSYHDLRTGFLFGASAGGVKFDEIYTNDGDVSDDSWEPNWWVHTSINKEGWVAEMKIPFSQLRFDKNSGTVWGLEVGRILYRKNETDFWQHIPKEEAGLVHLFGELKGLEQIKPRKILDVTPYIVAKTETFERIPENPFLAKGKSSKINGGIDAKIGVTNNMTMDLTINPDFGQVEADPSQVNLTAFETFFSEKRPFFVEGNNITNFGFGMGDGNDGNDNLFYSRRIGGRPQVNPDMKFGWYADVPTQSTIIGAAKLTGKTRNGLSIGFVEAVTGEESAKIDTIGGRTSRTVEPLTNYLIGRLQKDNNDGNTVIGGIITATNRALNDYVRDYLHESAYSAGVDFTQYFKDKSWKFNFNNAFSHVRGSAEVITNTQKSSARFYQRIDNNHTKLDITRTSLTGAGGRVQLMKLNGHWNFMGTTIWKTPGFEINDMGFMREADQVLSVLWGQYTQFNPKGFYRSYNIDCNVYSLWNFGGDPLAKGLDWNSNLDLKNFWRFNTGLSFRSNNRDQTILRGGPMMKIPGYWNVRFGFSSDSHKKFVYSVNANYQSGYEKSSFGYFAGSYFTFKPTKYLSIDFNPGYNNSFNQLQYVSTINSNPRNKYIFASIDQKAFSASLRINLNLSPNLSLQYWGQPFVASGKFNDYKQITSPMADTFEERFRIYSKAQLSRNDNEYSVDENLDRKIDYTFWNENFNFKEFLSNLVMRWEYSPGSSVFLVWNQSRRSQNNSGNMDLVDDLDVLFNSNNNHPHNVFLLKFSYRFGLN